MCAGDSVTVLIIGGGVCGVLAGQRCAARGLSFCIVDRGVDFGGVWGSLANAHSQLQAFEALYRWDPSFPLGKPLAKLSSGTVREKLQSYARLHSLYDRARFCSTVVNVSSDEQTDRYLAAIEDHRSGKVYTVSAEYLVVACGLLDKQYTPQDRRLPSMAAYRGFYTLAGRADRRDSLVGSSDLLDKEVVILGSGAFACEAMEAAAKAGAAKITLVSRERKRWILPFSRQFTVTFLTYLPLVPWRCKMALVRGYLRRFYYSRAGLSHVAPAEVAQDMDYTGQCNDAIFHLSRAGVLSVLVDSVASFVRDGVVLRSGRYLRADMLVMAAGCKYLSQPPCLRELGVGAARPRLARKGFRHLIVAWMSGLEQLPNYAFLGPTGRIAAASDLVYAFVPLGPTKQLDMFFHGVECRQRGKYKVFQAALQHTPLSPGDAGPGSQESAGKRPGTWFHTRHWYSSLNSGMEDRDEAYLRTMSVGLTWWRVVLMRVRLQLDTLSFWIISCLLSCVELTQLPVL